VLSPDGSTVAFSTPDPGGAKVWLLDAADMHVAARITLGRGASMVIFGPDGRSLVDLGFGGQPDPDAARLWRLEAVGTTALNLVTSAAVPRAPRAPRAFGAVAFSPDGGTLAVSANTGLTLLDAATLRTIRSVAAPPGVSGAPVYRPDGRVLAVGGAPGYLGGGSAAGAVCLLDATSLDVVARRSVPDLDAYSLAFSPHSRTLALVGQAKGSGGVIRVLDASSLRTVAAGVLPGGASVAAAAAAGFTPDGAVLAGYSMASGAVAWLMQVNTLEIIASMRLGPAADATNLAVDLSADGETLMVAYTSKRARAGRIQLYRIEPG
jgi:WD40 repeat protein